MYLLFLDTETSGVNSLTDQIIEIGGALVSIDELSFEMQPISNFQSLVSLRQPMDPIITRLTGITDQDLTTAPKLFAVQEMWLNWLESQLITDSKVIVIGHSLDFDLGFLNKERWFLPENYETIDTLNLAKILLPWLSAVNLEFLCSKLNLANSFPDELKDLAPHRALYDTYCCVYLFENLLQRLVNYKLDPELLTIIQDNFLPIDLNLIQLSQTNINMESHDQNQIDELQETKTELNWNGEIMDQSWNVRFDQAYKTLDLNELKVLSTARLPNRVILILSQIWAGINIKDRNSQFHLNFHGQSSDYLLLNLIFQSLLTPQNTDSDLFGSEEKILLAPLENLTWQIDHLSRHWFNLGLLIDLLELWKDLVGIESGQNEEDLVQSNIGKEAIVVQKFLGGYDFLNISLQPLLEYNQFNWNPSSASFREEAVGRRIESFEEEFNILKTTKLASNNVLTQTVVSCIKELINQGNFQPNQLLTFHLIRDKIQISWDKTNFDLVQYLEEILDKYPQLELQTYLDPSQTIDFLETVGLHQLVTDKQVPIEYLLTTKNIITTVNVTSLAAFIEIQIQQSLESDQPIIILAANNPIIKECERILTNQFESDQYLILGESGSLTKIRSKIANGFLGVVVLKAKDLSGLYRGSDTLKIKEIFFLKTPYTIMPKFWHQKNLDTPIRHHNFLAQANLAKANLNCPIHLVEL